MFAGLLRGSGATVRIVDPALGSGDITAVDVTLAGRLHAADGVLLAVPEPVAMAAARPVIAAMHPGALLVDTLSVKSRYAEIVQEAGDIQAVGLNPMFAPSLGLPGRPVAAVTYRDGPAVTHLLGLLDTWGGRVVPVSATSHDRLTASIQALTHATVLAFGQALDQLGLPIGSLTALASPPHATLLALLARIAAGSPDVYWEVQAANPRAPAARAALADAVRTLADLIDQGDHTAFAAELDRARRLLGGHLDHYRALCAGFFAALPKGNLR
jgi:prephenate dehydrogenase